jgi:hypothetical protein
MAGKIDNRRNEFAAAVRERAPQNVLGSLPANYDRPFERALIILGIKRFPWLTNWRCGHCAPAPWAIELIANQLREYAAFASELERGVWSELGPGSPGKAGAAALARWRERKARERDEKEKAAQAALSQSPVKSD